jgi:hypothetical protein
VDWEPEESSCAFDSVVVFGKFVDRGSASFRGSVLGRIWNLCRNGVFPLSLMARGKLERREASGKKLNFSDPPIQLEPVKSTK